MHSIQKGLRPEFEELFIEVKFFSLIRDFLCGFELHIMRYGVSALWFVIPYTVNLSTDNHAADVANPCLNNSTILTIVVYHVSFSIFDILSTRFHVWFVQGRQRFEFIPLYLGGLISNEPYPNTTLPQRAGCCENRGCRF